MSLAVRALRGATTVAADDPAEITERVKALMAALFERNSLHPDDLISIVVTATPDIHSKHPATAVREFGLAHVPILGAQELEIDGSLPRCIRLLMHVSTGLGRSDLKHVFLEGATVLRPDLT